MPGNADKLRAASHEIIAIRDLVYGALHAAQQIPPSLAGWSGVAADGYESMRTGPNGALDSMTKLIQVLQSTADWLDNQAHQVDESNSFLHSVLGQIVMAIATTVVAIAAAAVAPVILGAVAGGIAAVGSAAIDTLGVAETVGAGFEEGLTAGVADVVGPVAVAGPAGDIGTTVGTAAAIDGTPASVVGAVGAETTPSGIAATTTAIDGTIVPTAQAAMDGLASDVVPQQVAALAGLLRNAGIAPGEAGAGGALVSPSEGSASSVSAAGDATGGGGAAEGGTGAGSGGRAASTSEIQPAPASQGSAAVTVSGADGGSAGASGPVADAASESEAAAQAAGKPSLALPSAKEVGHSLALVLTQSGTDAAGQTLVQAVSNAVEHHGQFWKFNQTEGLLIAGSSLGIPLAQAFNLVLRSIPGLGRYVVDVGLNWKLPKLPSVLATLGNKPQLNIWFTYGNAGVAAYGLDSKFTGQHFSVLGALISYGGYGVLAAADQKLIAARSNWIHPLAPHPASLPKNYRGGKVNDPMISAFLGGGGRGIGKTVSVGPAGHGWTPHPGPYIDSIGPKIANRAWYYALDHEWVYENSAVPGVHGGHKLYVLPSAPGEQPAPVVPRVNGRGSAGITSPRTTPVSGVPGPARSRPGHGTGSTPPAPPAHPAHPAALVPMPQQVTATLARDQQMLQQQQGVLNEQLAQLATLSAQLRQLPQSPAVRTLEHTVASIRTPITEQQKVLTEDAQAIGELQAHPNSAAAAQLTGPASAFVQASWAEILSREFAIAQQIGAVQSALPTVTAQAQHWPAVPAVTP